MRERERKKETKRACRWLVAFPLLSLALRFFISPSVFLASFQLTGHLLEVLEVGGPRRGGEGADAAASEAVEVAAEHGERRRDGGSEEAGAASAAEVLAVVVGRQRPRGRGSSRGGRGGLVEEGRRGVAGRHLFRAERYSEPLSSFLFFACK